MGSRRRIAIAGPGVVPAAALGAAAQEETSTSYEEFATGFAGFPPPVKATDAAHRSMGLAMAPDGALLVSVDHKSRLRRIRYAGK